MLTDSKIRSFAFTIWPDAYRVIIVLHLDKPKNSLTIGNMTLPLKMDLYEVDGQKVWIGITYGAIAWAYFEGSEITT